MAVSVRVKWWVKALPAAIDTANFYIKSIIHHFFCHEPPSAFLTGFRHGSSFRSSHGVAPSHKNKAQGIFRYLGLRSYDLWPRPGFSQLTENLIDMYSHYHLPGLVSTSM